MGDARPDATEPLWVRFTGRGRLGSQIRLRLPGFSWKRFSYCRFDHSFHNRRVSRERQRVNHIIELPNRERPFKENLQRQT